MKKIIIALLLIGAFLFGLYLAYLIHFKWCYFGATFITTKTILGNWIGTPLFTTLFMIILIPSLSKHKY